MLKTLPEEVVQKLNAPLDQSVVKTRVQGGKLLSYVEAHYCIRRANEIFGFGNWQRHTLRNELICSEEVSRDGREGWRVAYMAQVRVAVRIGDEWITHEGTGFGESTSYVSPGQAHENAAKEAESDAMKRALICWGDQFGLVLYSDDNEESEDLPQCPQCGKPMVLRSGKRGEFWGCTGYPNCRYTMEVGAEKDAEGQTEEDGERTRTVSSVRESAPSSPDIDTLWEETWKAVSARLGREVGPDDADVVESMERWAASHGDGSIVKLEDWTPEMIIRFRAAATRKSSGQSQGSE